MASTPPLQLLASPQTPATPLHGGEVNPPSRRYSTRLSLQKASRVSQTTPNPTLATPRDRRSTATPDRSRRAPPKSCLDPHQLHSPRASPKQTPHRRVPITSSASPSFAPSAPLPSVTTSAHPTLPISTSTMSEGMLPTPVKTPRKKSVPDAHAAARALFQDQPIIGEEIAATTRRGRKQRRYNGFSLESFSAEDDEARGQMTIFTDSRDNVPQLDPKEDNPFVKPPVTEGGPSTKKLMGTIKRRKITGELRKDQQVEEAIKNDEGMVYVL